MPHYGPTQSTYDADALRIEAVTVCVGFDDMLDVTLGLNHPHFDTLIVVTNHSDRKTHAVCRKHGAMCVQTDLFKKNGRNFNKGAAINAGFNYFQWWGWRVHLDADIVVPDNFRRMLFNHSHLDRRCLYGADRLDVIGLDTLTKVRTNPQHRHSCLVQPHAETPLGARYVSPLEGYQPLGFFQLWHSSQHKPYPYSLGSAAHDDTMFAAKWAHADRRLLPTVMVHHLCAHKPVWGENWNGVRKMPRIS